MSEFKFLLNILRMNGQNLSKFCIHIIIDKIWIVKDRFFCKVASRLLNIYLSSDSAMAGL